jgi:hypothetical protein
LPDVNFDTRACIIVYQGQQRTGGYSVEIAEISRDGTRLAVKVREQRPAFGDITTQVITSPFVAVSISRPPQGASVVLASEGAGNATEPNRKINVKRRGRRGLRRRY